MKNDILKTIIFFIFIYISIFFGEFVSSGAFAAVTDKDFTVDDGVTDSPQIILRDQDNFDFTFQKLDSGAADIINTEGIISIKPSGDTDDYMYLLTGTDLSGVFWAGVLTYTNDPAIRINASGQLEYRDQNSASYVPFDNLGAAATSLGDLADVSLTGLAQGDVIFYNGTNWVNLGSGTSGQFLKTQGAGANPTWDSSTSGGVTAVGSCATGNCFVDGGSDDSLIFEGATDNAFEITLSAADAGADATVTIPATTGTLVTTGDTGTVTGTMILNNTVALATDTAGDYAASITGGDGISSTGATSGENISHTLAVDLVTAGADADSTTVQSDSGTEFVGNKLTLLRGCSDSQILKWDETQDDWNCEADADSGGAGGLDAVYNSGSSIDVDTSAVTLTVSDTDNNEALTVVQNDTTNNPVAMSITNTGTGDSLQITNNSSIANAVVDVVTITKDTSGVSAAGIGTGLTFNIEHGGGVSEEQASMDVVLTDVTDTAEVADIIFNVKQAGTITELARLDGSADSLVVSGEITVPATSGIDVLSAGLLDIGANTATSIGYGSGSVTAHIFSSDGTGDAEVVLPTGSIGTSEILDATVLEADLNVSNGPTDNYMLTYNSASSNFTWVDPATAGSSTAYDSISDPGGNSSIGFAALSNTWTVGAMDAAFWKIDQTGNAGAFDLVEFAADDADVTALLRLDNEGAVTIADALLFDTSDASAVFTDAIDASDAGITNALNIGANTILGTTGVIDFTSFDVSSAGAITTLGNETIIKADPSIIFDVTTATDTDFWIGAVDDAGGDDDDIFQIGDGTTPGTNPFLTIDTSGDVGIGTATTTSKFTVSDTNTSTSGTLYLSENNFSVNPGAASTGDFTANYNYLNVPASVTNGITTLRGAYNFVNALPNGATITNAYGSYNESKLTDTTSGTGIITNAYGSYNRVDKNFGNITNAYGSYNEVVGTSAVGVVTNAYGVYVPSLATTRFTNAYSLYLADQGSGANDWAIYSVGGKSYLAENLGIGDTTPTSLLTVGNGDLFQVNSSGQIAAIAGLSGVTGTYDFGGATSIEIVNGAAPTVDTTGEIVVDTTADDLVIYGASAQRVITYERSKSFVLFIPADSDRLIVWQAPYNVTVTGINCIVDPADSSESAVIALYESSSTGDFTDLATNGLDGTTTITCSNTGVNDDGTLSNPTVTSGNWVGIDVGTVTGTVSALTVTWTFTKDRE